MKKQPARSSGHYSPTTEPAAAPHHSIKFQLTDLSCGSVPRDRLLTTLEQQSNAHMVLLLAPAGFGKTTLMTQWRQRLQQRQCHASWLTLDEADNDPERLMSNLYSALRDWMQIALGCADAARVESFDWLSLLGRVDTSAQPLTLFLDEFEQLNCASTLHLVKRLIERLPHQVRLVIASRNKPALGLERYRMRGELLVLAAADLRFDADETLRFFSFHVVGPIGNRVIEKLHAITNGWPAAMQLIALTVRTSTDLEHYAGDLSNSLAHISDYLTEDVLNVQSSEVRRWRLLKLMLLRTLTLDADGDREAARSELVQALQLGARIGARRSFAEGGMQIESMLTELPQQMLASLSGAGTVITYWRDLRGEIPVPSNVEIMSGIRLSERERIILKMLATGMENEQLAKAICLSVNTVKWYIRRLLKKLDARNRSEAVFIARSRGLLEP